MDVNVSFLDIGKSADAEGRVYGNISTGWFQSHPGSDNNPEGGAALRCYRSNAPYISAQNGIR